MHENSFAQRFAERRRLLYLTFVVGLVLCVLSLHGGYAMVVLANNLYISLTIQLNSTALTTFELHIDEEVDNYNKVYKRYERSMVRTVYDTNSQWYEKSRHQSEDFKITEQKC